MRKLTNVFTVAVLALWGLATAHCSLEQVPGFEFLAWCHTQQGCAQQENGCDGDPCSVVEAGLYKAEEPAQVPAPVWVVSFVVPLWESTPPETVPQFAPPNESPPELPRVWQFSCRTALPPRAPASVA